MSGIDALTRKDWSYLTLFLLCEYIATSQPSANQRMDLDSVSCTLQIKYLLYKLQAYDNLLFHLKLIKTIILGTRELRKLTLFYWTMSYRWVLQALPAIGGSPDPREMTGCDSKP